MNAPAGPLWTADQLRWLAALELKPWMLGGLPEAVAVAHEVLDATPPRLSPAVRQFQSGASRPQRPAPAPRDDAPVAGEPRPAPRRVAAPSVPDRLHFALIRASGLDPNSADAQAIIATWPASAELRADPRAKRALWPQLRKLRKAARLQVASAEAR